MWKPKRCIKRVALRDSIAMHEIEKHKRDLHERQQKLLSRVHATREVLKVQREELATLEEENEGEDMVGNTQTNSQQRATERRKWRNVITRVIEENGETKLRECRNRNKQQTLSFHAAVSQYVALMARTPPYCETTTTPATNPKVPKVPMSRAISHSLKVPPPRTVVMPLRQWKSLVFDDQHKKTAAAAAADTNQKHTGQISEFEISVQDKVLDTTPTKASDGELVN